jgi:radical SAM superfamily enzyme with C-terminal helix-hairpin-helix motif
LEASLGCQQVPSQTDLLSFKTKQHLEALSLSLCSSFSFFEYGKPVFVEIETDCSSSEFVPGICSKCFSPDLVAIYRNMMD